MKTKEAEFKKEKLAQLMKISKLQIAQEGDDCVRDILTAKMEGYILSHLTETRTLSYYTPKPKFLDWLLGRTKRVEIEVNAKDCLKNPPTLEHHTYRMITMDIATEWEDTIGYDKQINKP